MPIKNHKLDMLELSYYIISDLITIKLSDGFLFSSFVEEFPYIIVGKRKIEFNKKDTVIFYGYAENWHPYGIFDMFDTKKILSYLLEPESIPPILVSDVYEIVSALTKATVNFAVSWDDPDHPEVRSGDARVVFSFGAPREINYYDGEEDFGLVETASAVKYFIEADKRRKK